MFKRTLTAALIFGAAALAPPPAAAQMQPPCLARETLIQTLAGNYQEKLTGGGFRSQNELVEVWTSPETGSFTVFISRADGVACVLAAGKHWYSVTKPVPGGIAG